MLSPEFFERFGMLVIDDFLDRRTCARLRRAVRGAAKTEAKVWSNGEDRLDRTRRRTKRATVSAEDHAYVERRLIAIKPRVERHFRLKLRGVQAPQFLIYRRGDFFEFHTDSEPKASAPKNLRRRRLSVVISLSGDALDEKPDGSDGGSLMFQGLFAGERSNALSFPLSRKQGLLIVFRSEILHAVSPVKRGERYSIVSWYV